MDPVTPSDPLPPDLPIGSAKDLRDVLARIDGWGEHGWRLVSGAWRLPGAVLVVEPRERDADPLVTLVIDPHPFARLGDEGDRAAVCDWALARCRALLVPRSPVRFVTAPEGPAVRATSACFLDRHRLCLRLLIRWPFAGMCCDGPRFARFVHRLAVCAKTLAGARREAALRHLRRTVAIQRALRAALPDHGLVAFLAIGSRLARASDGGPAPRCRPLRVPARLAVTIDLGPLGRHRGLGIRRGVTAILGAPYHGKSTLLQAIAAGRDDHRPGDGREGVVSDAEALVVQAEDGRRIKDQDLTPFFAALPVGDARRFTTERASGATSMAASVLQGIAAGSRLLLIDEDTAAGNFLWLDPAMRRLLGRAARGGRTLVDRLRDLTANGISTVLAVGSATPALGAADRIVLLEDFQPRDATARARRLTPRAARGRPLVLPPRILDTDPESLLEHRHFLHIDARECERPRLELQGRTLLLDLRRAGWHLDEDLVRGACCAAAWCLRLAKDTAMPMTDLAHRFRAWSSHGGVRVLDPFATSFVTAPPWPLVAAILERLPEVAIGSGGRRHRDP